MHTVTSFRGISWIIATLVLALCATPASAAMVNLQITNTTVGNFSASEIHSADTTGGNVVYDNTLGYDHYKNGNNLSGAFSGTLTASLSTVGGVTSFTNISGIIDTSSGASIVVNNSSFLNEGLGVTDGTHSCLSFACGQLNVSIWSAPGGTGTLQQTTTFFIDPYAAASDPTNGPNQISATNSLATALPSAWVLWGNNFHTATVGAACDTGGLSQCQLGLDLTAQVTPVPLPATSLLLLGALSALVLVERRRRTASAAC